MTPEQQPKNLLREAYLQGKNPIDFIIEDVQHRKELYKNILQKEWSDFDLADFLCARIVSGIITEQEMIDSLPHLGLSELESAKFLEETIPQTMSLIKTQQRTQPLPRISGIRYFGPSQETPQGNP